MGDRNRDAPDGEASDDEAQAGMSGGRTRARHARDAAPVIATFREGSLHAALKERYALSTAGAAIEASVDGFVIDVAGRDELIEIQTVGFAGARRKLERLVDRHRVVLVHPMPVEKWLVRVDADGAIVSRRRSPKRAVPLDLFDELVHLTTLFGHPNFHLELLLTREEEIRGPIPVGARYRYARTWWRLDRRLIDVVEVRRLATPSDLLALVPPEVPETFTTSDIVSASGRSRRLAMRVAYCLERAGAIVAIGRRGRHVAYRRVAAVDLGNRSAAETSLGASRSDRAPPYASTLPETNRRDHDPDGVP